MMKWLSKVFFSALMVFILTIPGTRIFAEDPSPSELDNLMDNAQEKNKPKETIPKKDKVSSEDAEWFAKQVSASGGTDEQKKWANEIKKVADSPESKKIQAMKELIKEKFQISIFEGTDDGGPREYKEDTKSWNGSAWTMDQLQTVYETLDALPKDFRKETRKITKFKREIGVDDDEGGDPVELDTFGRVLDSSRDTVNLFDLIFEDPKYAVSPEKGKSKLKATLTHEMTHCFQFANRSTLVDWDNKFWVKATTYNDASGLPMPEGHPIKKINWEVLSPMGFWENGISVSTYGGVTQRRTDNSEPINIGMEDMAESTTFSACASKLMEERFPARFEFVKNRILNGADFTKSEVPDIVFNPRWYGYSETEILHQPPKGSRKSDWADVGVAGSYPESYSKIRFFVNTSQPELNSLCSSTTIDLKSYATIGEVNAR